MPSLRAAPPPVDRPAGPSSRSRRRPTCLRRPRTTKSSPTRWDITVRSGAWTRAGASAWACAPGGCSFVRIPRHADAGVGKDVRSHSALLYAGVGVGEDIPFPGAIATGTLIVASNAPRWCHRCDKAHYSYHFRLKTQKAIIDNCPASCMSTHAAEKTYMIRITRSRYLVDGPYQATVKTRGADGVWTLRIALQSAWAMTRVRWRVLRGSCCFCVPFSLLSRRGGKGRGWVLWWVGEGKKVYGNRRETKEREGKKKEKKTPLSVLIDVVSVIACMSPAVLHAQL